MNDKTITELGSRKISIVIGRWLADQLFRHRQTIDLLAPDKSQYFAQPRPIIDNCVAYDATIFLAFLTNRTN